MTTAKAKGLRESRVLRGHAVPNALLPTVSLIGINLGFIIAGAITVEVVFSWPGLGTLTQEALEARDYPVLQAIFLILADHGRARQPRRGHRLRPARSAGPDVTADSATLQPARPAAERLVAARRPLARLRGRLLHRPEGAVGAAIIVFFAILALSPSPDRRAAGDRHERQRRPARAALGGAPAGHRQPRPRRPQPDRPRRADLDAHRVPRDARDGRHRGAARHRVGLRRRVGPTRSSCASPTSSWSCRRSSSR